MKTCSKCKIAKNFSDFSKSTQVKDGYKSACKSCLRLANQDYYDRNREKESIRKKKAYSINSEKIIAQQLKYYAEKKEERAKWVKKKRLERPEVFKSYGQQFRSDHPEYHKKYRKTRMKIDANFKLISLLRTRTSSFLRARPFSKIQSFKQYIGCSVDDLRLHLQKQFRPGMTWMNHSPNGWHIDHIIPLSSAKTEEELYTLCHYSNLQPLWAIDNLKKAGKT